MLDVALPNAHAIAVMILIVVALILFTWNSIPLETTSLVVLVALAVGFTLFPFVQDGEVFSPASFFSGFGHKALVAVCALMIVGRGLIRTGALEPIGRYLAKAWRRWPGISLLFTLLITGFLSAFINNTPIRIKRLIFLISSTIFPHETRKRFYVGSLFQTALMNLFRVIFNRRAELNETALRQPTWATMRSRVSRGKFFGRASHRG